MSMTKQYNLDRKGASRLLKVSIRTLDRYIRGKKLSTRLEDGRIWLDRNEIVNFRTRQSRQARVDNVDMSTPHLSIDNDVDNVDSQVDKVDTVKLMGSKRPRSGKQTIYKKLYEELKGEINEKQARLEIANYRVGQLESQVKNSIPLLEYHRESYEKKQKQEVLTKELKTSTSIIQKLKIELRFSRFSKKVFIILLLVTLALQPLWLLFLYKP